jgi:hypothetical protein
VFKTLINKGVEKIVQIPLSPPAEKQFELKRCKTYVLQRFFFYSISN